MQSLKSIGQAEVDNFFKQSFEQKNWFHCIELEPQARVYAEAFSSW